MYDKLHNGLCEWPIRAIRGGTIWFCAEMRVIPSAAQIMFDSRYLTVFPDCAVAGMRQENAGKYVYGIYL